MKSLFPLLIAAALLVACSKQDTATRTEHYRKITYRIESNDSNLLVNFARAVYDDKQKGNIQKDSLLAAPGTYVLPATVLANEEIELFGLSYISGNFRLQIIGDGQQVLAQTDSVPLDPANQLHPDRWFVKIKAIP